MVFSSLLLGIIKVNFVSALASCVGSLSSSSFVFFLSHTESTEITELTVLELLVHAGAGIRGLCRRLCHDCLAGCSANHLICLVVLIAPATVPLRQGDERSGGGWMVIVFVIVFCLTQTAQNTQNYLSSSRLFTLALESAEGHSFHCACLAGCSANRSSAHRLSFLLSHFSVPTAPAVVT